MKDFWTHIPKEYHKSIRDMSLPVSKQKKEILFLEGKPFKGFYIVEKGSFRVYKGNTEGEEATLSLVYPGQMISAIPIITEEIAYHADCESLENSKVLFLSEKKFRTLLISQPTLQMKFSQLILTYVLEIRTKYLSLILKSASDRFLDFLRINERQNEIQNEKKRGGKDSYFTLPVPKKHIAALLDITPESLSRIIAKLETDKKISVQGKKFKILH